MALIQGSSIHTQQPKKKPEETPSQGRIPRASSPAAQAAATPQPSPALAPLQPVLPGRSLALAASPADAQIQSIVTGYFNATGRIIGAKKIQDALAIAKPEDTIATWQQRFKLLNDSSLTPEQQAQASAEDLPAEDLLYTGKTIQKTPLATKIVGAVYSNADQWLQQSPIYNLLGKTVASDKINNTFVPATQSVQTLLKLSGNDQQTTSEYLDAHGFKGEVTNSLGQQVMAPLSDQARYEQQIKQWAFAANAAPALLKNDPKARQALWDSGVVPMDQDPTTYFKNMYASDEDYKAFLYNLKYQAGVPGITPEMFPAFYAHEYGKDNLPAQVHQYWLAQQTNAATILTEGVPAFLAQPGYMIHEGGLNSIPGFKEATRDGAPLAEAMTNILSWQIKVPSVTSKSLHFQGETGTWTLPTVGEILNSPFRAAHRQLVFDTYYIAAQLKLGAVDQQEFDAQTTLVGRLSDLYKQTGGKTAGREWVRAFGGDPDTNPFGGLLDFGLETGVAIGGDVLLRAGVRAALGTKTVQEMAKSMNVRTNVEIMAQTGSPYALMDAYPIDAKAAKYIAKNLHTPEDVLAWLDKEGPGYFGESPNWSPMSLSLVTQKHFKILQDGTLHPRQRSLYLSMEEGPVDLKLEGAQRGFEQAIHFGVDPSDALKWADQMTCYMADDSPQGADARWMHYKDLEEKIIPRVLKVQTPQRGFLNNWDAFQAWDKLYKQKVAGSVGMAPNSLFYPEAVETGTGTQFVEGSKAISREFTRASKEQALSLRDEAKGIRKQILDIRSKGNLSADDKKALADLESKRADLHARRAQLVESLRNATPSSQGEAVPLTEKQFPRTYHPQLSARSGAIFNGGSAMQKWTLKQEQLHINWATSLQKRILLAKNSTILNIIYGDEGLRVLLSGMNPLRGIRGLRNIPGFSSKVTKDIQNILDTTPMLKHNLSELADIHRRSSWGFVSPNDPNFGQAIRLVVPKTLKTRPYMDWIDGFTQSLEKQGYGEAVVSPRTADIPFNVIEKAADDASARLKKLAYTDEFYHNATHTGMLDRLGHIQDKYLSKMGLRDTVDDWVKTIDDRPRRMAHNGVTRDHLLNGSAAIRDTDFQNADIRNIYGPVQAPTKDAIRTLPRKTPVRWAAAAWDAPFTLLDSLTQTQRNELFAGLYDRHASFLKELYPEMDEATIQERATLKAFRETKAKVYLTTHSLAEENLRNIVMFLPAYRQMWKYWLPLIGRNPLKSVAVFNDVHKLQQQKWQVPDWVPVAGGLSKESLASLGFMPNPDQPLRILPPVSFVAMDGLEAASVLGAGSPVGETAQKYYTTLTGGFEPGSPWNRPVDEVVWSLADFIGAGGAYRSVAELLPGTKQLEDSRIRAMHAQLVVQAITSEGTKIDPGAAENKIRELEAVRGALTYALPGTLSRALPVVTVQENGKPLKIDLARVAQAQYLYLTTPVAQRGEILQQYPEYKPIAIAWEKRGDDQLAYLSEHSWVIPFVTRRRDVSSQDAALIGSPTGELVDPKVLAENIKAKYREVWGYEIGQAYKSGLAEVQTSFEKAERKELGKDYKSTFTYKGDVKDRLAKLVQTYQNDFLSGWKGRIEAAWPNVDLNGADKNGTPLWVAGATQSTSSLNTSTYESMKALDDSGVAGAETMVKNNPLYPLYVKQRQGEVDNRLKVAAQAATTTYKDSLTPPDWAALGLPLKKDESDALRGFRKLLDERKQAMAVVAKKYGYGTTGYRQEYSKWDVRLFNYPNLRPEVKFLLTSSSGQLLRRVGLATPKIGEYWKTPNPEFAQQYKRAAAPKIAGYTLWKFFNKPTTSNDKVAEVYRNLSPQAQDIFAEKLRAGAWDSILQWGDYYRNKLGTMTSYYTANGRKVQAWGIGFSTSSKNGKEYKQMMSDYINTIRSFTRKITGRDLLRGDVDQYFNGDDSSSIARKLITW